MEADFMERFLAAVENYQGVLEALRIADAEDYHILKIRCVLRTTGHILVVARSSEPHHMILDGTQLLVCVPLHHPCLQLLINLL